MIDALIAGRIHGTPAERTAKNGKPFATAEVRVSTRDGEAIFVNVIAFAEGAVTALLALGDTDSVALTGERTARVRTTAGRSSTVPGPSGTCRYQPLQRRAQAQEGMPARRRRAPV